MIDRETNMFGRVIRQVVTTYNLTAKFKVSGLTVHIPFNSMTQLTAVVSELAPVLSFWSVEVVSCIQ
jgi:hypothetical protein